MSNVNLEIFFQENCVVDLKWIFSLLEENNPGTCYTSYEKLNIANNRWYVLASVISHSDTKGSSLT